VGLQLDGREMKTDFTDDGRYVFKGLGAGEHTVVGWVLNKSGKEIPDATCKLTFKLPDKLEGGLPPEPYFLEIYRAEGNTTKPTDYKKVATLPFTRHQFDDKISQKAVDGEFSYFLRVVDPRGNYTDSRLLGPISPEGNLFHTGKISVFIMIMIFLIIATYFLINAQRGKKYYIRPIPGISHIDEALGRATEMGKPILYVLGLDAISQLNTLAGITILGRVARKAAEYQLRVIVPCYDPIVMLVAQETVKSAFTDAGRPDLYREEDTFFVTSSQFAYAAAVSGIMAREKPATNFYMGGFYAESLLLTETGTTTGSIQIAGSDAITQLPFFITTCDYTLIGEELYAASAYLSKDPHQIASLKVQDMNKLVIMILMAAGIISVSVGWQWIYNFFFISQ